MTRFRLIRELMAEQERKERAAINLGELSIALEHQTYKNIPRTNNSVRHDKGNANTLTQDHAHVYATRNGGGKELYSINMDGTSHDGSSGARIPAKHAEYFRELGYLVPDDLTLESINYEEIEKADFEFCFLTEDT